VFGGNTALSVMQAVGCVQLWPLDEVLPGLACSAPVGLRHPAMLVTKSGGFGPEDVVARIRQHLRG
jgi:uncharacterized protein YgbK (DUF1537 family)